MVKAGCEEMLRQLEKLRLTKVPNDNSLEHAEPGAAVLFDSLAAATSWLRQQEPR